MGAYIRKRGVTGYVDCSGLFSKGHAIDRWHRKAGLAVKTEAVGLAPVRSGRLKGSIRLSGPHKYGDSGSEMSIRATAPYAFFVHDGTVGPITSRSGKPMPMSSFPRGGRGAIKGYNEAVGSIYKRKKPVRERGKMPSHYGVSKKTRWNPFPAYQHSVSGQDANPFLATAAATVGARRGWKKSRLRVGDWDFDY